MGGGIILYILKMFNFWSVNLRTNIRKFYLVGFLEALWFPLPIFIIYLTDSGLDLGQVGILLSVLVLVQVIFEIPSSVWADRYSRKRILVTGGIFLLLSSLVLYAGKSFGYFLIAMAFMGFSSALRSGTDSAMVYDTLLNLKEENKYEKTQSKIMVCFFWSRIVGSAAGAFMYTLDHKLPFLLTIFANLCLIATLASLKEPEFHRSSGTHFAQFKEGLGYLMKQKGAWNIVVVFSLMLAMSDILFYYYQPVLESAGLTVIYLSFVYVGVNLASSMGSMAYPYIEKKYSHRKILVFYLLITVLCSMAFMTKDIGIILFFIAFLSFNFGNQYTYITSVINRIVPSSHRATAISIHSQLYLLIFSIMIIIIGRVSSLYSIPYGMGVNLTLALIIYVLFMFKKQRKTL